MGRTNNFITWREIMSRSLELDINLGAGYLGTKERTREGTKTKITNTRDLSVSSAKYTYQFPPTQHTKEDLLFRNTKVSCWDLHNSPAVYQFYWHHLPSAFLERKTKRRRRQSLKPRSVVDLVSGLRFPRRTG